MQLLDSPKDRGLILVEGGGLNTRSTLAYIGTSTARTIPPTTGVETEREYPGAELDITTAG